MTPTRIRAAITGTIAALALGAATLTIPGTATSTPVPTAFASQLVTVDAPTQMDRIRLGKLGLDLTEHAGQDYVEVVLHTAAQRALLRSAGFTYEVRIPDLARRKAQIAELDKAFAARVGRSKLPSGRTSYRVLADYERELQAMAKAKPRLVRHFLLPRPTLDGNRLHAVEIGANVKRKDGRPTFVLMGLHHAREWPSGELAIEFAHDLVKGFGKDKRITRLLKKGRVVVVPVVNPDGFDLSRTDGEVLDLNFLNSLDPLGGQSSVIVTPGHAYKRKNCRVIDGQDIPDGTCRLSLTSNLGAGVGVDLNRNYGGLWGGPGAAPGFGEEGGSGGVDVNESLGQLSPIYRGPAPFSEPETANIRDLVAGRQTTMMISNHTFSNLILRPNGVNPQTIGPDGLPVGDSPDEQGLKRLGAKMAAANGYANIHGWELYDTTGTTEDWSYNATGGYGYTFEIGPDEFHPPYENVVNEYVGAGKFAGKGNREAYLVALEHAVDNRFHGVLTGTAPKGTTLRLSKKFRTPTWGGSFADSVASSMTVGKSGRFRWVVNPSTRPAVRSKTYTKLAAKPTVSRTYEGGAIQPTESVDHEFRVAKAADVLRVDLDWPTPDDLDLQVLRKNADGSLTEVGTSGNLPGEKESAMVAKPTPGTYVLRVVNYASVTPSYTLTAGLFNGTTVRTAGKTERYTLTWSRGGKVLGSRQVLVKRGQLIRMRLARR